MRLMINKKTKLGFVVLGMIICLAAAVSGSHYSSRPGKAFTSEKSALIYLQSQWEALIKSTETAWDTSWNASIRSKPSNKVVRQKLQLSLSDLRKAEKELRLLFENHYSEFSPAKQAVLKQILANSLAAVQKREAAIETVLTIQDDSRYLFDIMKNMPDISLQADNYLKAASEQWELLEN
ncbi:MAG: hypothetical protein ABFC84_12545 [Veillonellales bacterium]